MAREVRGLVQGVYVGRDADILVTTSQDAIALTWEGVLGDRHAGITRPADSRTPHYRRGTPIRNTRQVSLVSGEELAEIARRLDVPAVQPEWLGANVAVLGIPAFTLLPPASRLFFESGAVLAVEGENEPCRGPGVVLARHYPHIEGLASRFVRAALHRRGLVASVEHLGTIRVGDSVLARLPEVVPYPAS